MRARAGTWCYLAGLVAFFFLSLYLAMTMTHPGTADSLNNMDTARNMASGRGITSSMVQQYFFVQPLPNPENVRPPGAPMVLALLYLVGGVHLYWNVFLNGMCVALASLAIYAVGQRRWGPNAAGLCALAFLLSTRYEMTSFWSNNLLTLGTAALLWAAHCLPTGRRQTVILAVISAGVVWIKMTFGVSAGLVSLLALSRPGSSRRKELAIYCLLTFALITPFLVRSYLTSDNPLPQTSFRLAARYGLAKGDRFHTHKQFIFEYRIGHLPDWPEMVKIHGLEGILAVELLEWKTIAQDLVTKNIPFAILFIAGTVSLWRAHDRRWTAMLLATLVEPLLASGVLVFYQARFMWPCFPALLLLAGEILVRGRPAWRWLAVFTLGLFLFRAVVLWQIFFLESRRPDPTWAQSVTQLAGGKVVMSDFPWSVVWYTPSLSVVTPMTVRKDVLEVVDRYQVAYYLHSGHNPEPAPFAPEDLEILATGPNAQWAPQLWHPTRGWIEAPLYHPKNPWFLAKIIRPSAPAQ